MRLKTTILNVIIWWNGLNHFTLTIQLVKCMITYQRGWTNWHYLYKTQRSPIFQVGRTLITYTLEHYWPGNICVRWNWLSHYNVELGTCSNDNEYNQHQLCDTSSRGERFNCEQIKGCNRSCLLRWSRRHFSRDLCHQLHHSYRWTYICNTFTVDISSTPESLHYKPIKYGTCTVAKSL